MIQKQRRHVLLFHFLRKLLEPHFRSSLQTDLWRDSQKTFSPWLTPSPLIAALLLLYLSFFDSCDISTRRKLLLKERENKIQIFGTLLYLRREICRKKRNKKESDEKERKKERQERRKEGDWKGEKKEEKREKGDLPRWRKKERKKSCTHIIG